MATGRRSIARVVAILAVASGFAAGYAAASTGPLPSPDFTLDVDIVQNGRVLTYTISFANVGTGPAQTVVLRDHLPQESAYLGDPVDLVEGVWMKTYEDVGPGSYSETVAVELLEDVADGDYAVNTVELEYAGYTGVSVAAVYELEYQISFQEAPAPAFPLWVAAAPALPALAAGGGFAIYRRRRSPKLEQIFLMHSSGMLIHHWAANVSPSRDIDILSGMFVILKEFVRDSFREKTGGLTELRFGDSRVFLAEGEHAILAAVVNGERVNGLPSQIQAAVQDFERRNAAGIVAWNGDLDLLSGASDVVDDLVHGRYGQWRIAG